MFTKCLHDVEALVPLLMLAIQGDSAFRLETPEQRVKAINFEVCKNPQKLFGYHINVSWATAKHVSFTIN